MTDPVSAFIAELIRAANETDKLTNPERSGFLQRASATLRDYRHQINWSDAPTNDFDPNDVASKWSEMARLIELFSAEDVSKALLHAVACLRAARVLAEVKWDTEREI